MYPRLKNVVTGWVVESQVAFTVYYNLKLKSAYYAHLVHDIYSVYYL